jgi:hypothetical protein
MSNESATLDLPASAVTIPPAESSVAPIAGGKPKSALISYGDTGISPRTMEEAFILAKAILQSGMAPRAFDSEQKILIAVQMGAEVGLPPMAALQNIAVINGRPTIWGDAVPGICQALMEDYKQEVVGSDEHYGYRVTVKRKGRSEPVVATFTKAMATKAGLWGKAGPWTQYPERMLLNRARTFAMRDAFPDRMRGLLTAEEAQDAPPERNVTPSLNELDAPKATP